MRGTAAAYVRRRVAVQTFGVLVSLVAVTQLLELLDMTTDVLRRGQGLAGLAWYALLRLPSQVVLVLPIAVLLGAMTTLHSMARHLEVTTLRAAGVDLFRIARWLLPLGVLVAAAQFVATDRLLPVAEGALREWWRTHAPVDEKQPRLWAHTAEGPVSIDRISPDGRRLDDVRLYVRDDGGRIASRLAAESAAWDGRQWQLSSVLEVGIVDGAASGVSVARSASRPWQTNLRPEDVLRLDVQRPQLSSSMLSDVLSGQRVATQPLAWYETSWWRRFGAPLGVVVMLLLAVPVATAPSRNSGGGAALMAALVLGLAYLLVDGIVASLGGLGSVPPVATAFVVPLSFAALAVLRIALSQRP